MSKFEEVVVELKDDIEELETKVAEKLDGLDDSKKNIAIDFKDKAVGAINVAIDKISGVIENITDQEKLDDLLDKVKAKSREAIDYTLEKIDALKNDDSQIDIDKIHDDIMAEFDKLKGNEVIRKTTVLIKEGYAKINEFLDRPEVQETINKAKHTTIKVAEKGVEGLKKVLDVKEDETKPEEPKEE